MEVGEVYERSFDASVKAKERLRSRFLTRDLGNTWPVLEKASRVSVSADLNSIPGVAEYLARRKLEREPLVEEEMERVVLPNPPGLTPSIASMTVRLNHEIDRILAARV
jgi:hypothetical protein